jgi:hypothetical protein
MNAEEKRIAANRRTKKWRDAHLEQAREANRRWMASHPEYQYEYWKRNHLWLRAARYGLSKEEFDAMLRAQDGKCAICLTKLVLGGKGGMQIDHKRGTRKARGLLCRKCNVGLGQFDEKTQLLRAAIEYLETKI